MTRKPSDHQWVGYTSEQARLLDYLDFLGNNGWTRTPQSEALLPSLLGQLHKVGLPIGKVKEAMGSIGYQKQALHQLDRWESKRTTNKFGR